MCIRDRDGEPYYGSACVADWKGATNLLFTAAHNLLEDKGGKPCKSTDVLFIPAMKDKNDTSGSLYGRYAATAICWNKKWDPTAGHNDDAYDFGIVQLAPRADGKNVGQVVRLSTLFWMQSTQKVKHLGTLSDIQIVLITLMRR